MNSNNPSATNKTSKILIGVLTVLLIFIISVWLTEISIPNLNDVIDQESFAQKNFFTKLFILILILGIMWLSSRKLGITYGFTKGKNLNYLRFTKYAVILAIVALFCLIIFNIFGMILTGTKPSGFSSETILDRIFFIWIWSSIVEEILIRGWFQSFIGDLKTKAFSFRNKPISLKVLISALLFAFLHLSLFFEGMGVFFIAGILFNTFLLGLLAAYLREKTESIYPSIYVHIIFNVVGSLPLLLVNLLST